MKQCISPDCPNFKAGLFDPEWKVCASCSLCVEAKNNMFDFLKNVADGKKK